GVTEERRISEPLAASAAHGTTSIAVVFGISLPCASMHLHLLYQPTVILLCKECVSMMGEGSV
ncbi:UNVERIFIED_CONTAM: hypothetical protein NY603_31250, partial [Bacteroidetes bacterium 56_B9]